MKMKKITPLVLATLLFGLWGTFSKAADDYGQTYVVFLDGTRAGKETVTESVAGNGDKLAQTYDEIFLTDGLETNRMAYETRMVLNGKSWSPKSYMYRYVSGKSGDHYEVSIQGNTVTRTLTRGGESSIVTVDLKPDSVILDINVYNQYDYLIHKYDEKKGGRQLFSDFIPVVGNYIPIALTFLEDSKLMYPRGEIQVKKYQIEFVGLRNGTVLADNNGRLVQLVIPDQHLEVTREDLLPANR
jgi:hypothetical protein